MSKKISSYQKLKNQVAALNHDIYYILKKPNSVEGVIAKMTHQTRLDIEDIIWKDHNNSNSNFNGFLNQLEEVYNNIK